MLLNLVVLYSQDIQRSKAFYEALGLQFIKERHGQGSEHYACELNNTVLEIYPATAERPASTCIRLGFSVSSLDRVAERLTTLAGRLLFRPDESAWGKRAVVQDPDGHRVELLEPRKVEDESAP